MFGPFRLAAVVNRFWLILGLLFISRQWVPAAEMIPHDVLAHGDNEHFWVARVEQTPRAQTPLRTTIYYRLLGEEGKWQMLASIPARVVGLSSLNGSGAALLDDGTWMLLYPDAGPFTAGPLPVPARMVALAGGPTTWWAAGVVPGGMRGLAATTKPAAAATRASSSSQPASAPAATQPMQESRLVIFTLSANAWVPWTELPEPVAQAPNVSMAFVGDALCVATLSRGGGIVVRRLHDKKWVEDSALDHLPPLAGFALLGDPALLRAWVQPQTGPDMLCVFNRGTRTMLLPPIPGSALSGRAVTLAMGKLRTVGLVNGKLLGQDYKIETAAPDGKSYELAVPQASPVAEFWRLQFIIATLALIVAVLGSLRPRAVMRGTEPQLEGLRVAPLRRRLAAGFIDAAPMALAALSAVVRFRNVQVIPEQGSGVLSLIIYWSAGIFYILYMTVIESVAGRSLGKILMGLRIVGLDGQPARAPALVTRNVLRVIEVGLGFLPLLMIVVFPLRQRAGDVAAGTLVVTTDVVAPEPEKVAEPVGSAGEEP